MGNAPSQPTMRNLPMPRQGSSLCSYLIKQGFVFGKPLHGELTYSVVSPDGWCLRNISTSTYSDYVHLELIAPSGAVIASIGGKFTSYDSHCSMDDERDKNATVDLTKGSIVNGFFFDDRAVFQTNVKAYKALCRSCEGHSSKQEKCDAAYAALQKEATEHQFEFNVHRIVLGSDPVAGAAKAAVACASGLD